MTITHPATDRIDNAHDVVEYLIGQHMQIRDQFTEVLAVGPGNRGGAFRRLVTMLAAHETAEEQLVHPLVRGGVDGGNGIVDDRLREENVAKRQLADLEKLGVDDEHFIPQLLLLRDSVLAHANAEEAYEFRYIRQLDAGRTGSLLQLVKTAEALAPTHPHPGIESGTVNNLVGPLISLFDRTKDLVRYFCRKTPGRP